MSLETSQTWIPLITFFAASLAFLLLFALVARRTGAPFSVAFRLTRGLSSIVLTALGFFALLYWASRWRDAYLFRQDDLLARVLVMIPLAHFASDFALLAWGYVAHRSKPRTDLIIHHVLGTFAAGVVIHYGIAHALYLVLFTTEMMPITTAVSALGTWRGDPRLARLGARLRLVTLLGWRIPLWIAVGALLLYNLLGRAPDPVRLPGLRFGLSFLVITLSLDAYWTRASLRALRRDSGADEEAAMGKWKKAA